MLLEFIAMVAAAFGAAGIVLILNRLTGRRLPRWALPAGVAAAMFGYAIWSEYSWFDRASSGLGAGMKVVATSSGGAPWRPWSYVFPVTDRFVAVDTGRMVPHATAEGQRFLNAYWFTRWAPVRVATLMLDCIGRRGIELPPGADFPVEAIPPESEWKALPPGDPILAAACSEV
jgi:hypothetical protein